MKAIVLAAGEGTRLRPYTLDRPKCLVEVSGRSLLDRQVEVLHAEGIAPVVVVGGYLAEKLPRPGIELRRNPRYAETNMAYTLFTARADLAGGAVVAYGDIVYSRAVLRALLASDADIAVAIDLDWEQYWRQRNEDPLADAETLRLAEDGRILELGKKPRSLDDIEGQYMGLMKFSQKGAEQLSEVYALAGQRMEKAYMTDLLQAVIDAGHSVQSVPIRGGWVEVDTVADLESPVTRSRLVI